MATMKAPVLVLQGQCDFIPCAGAFEYVELFPNTTYDFMDGAGHTIWWDRPDDYRKRIFGFLEGLE